MMEKCIYFFEESLVYDFKLFKENIKNTKEYCILECDEANVFDLLFLKTILKFIVILLKRSCYKSAWEYNKMLIRLNPFKDPVGALIMIDHTALIARKYDWL